MQCLVNSIDIQRNMESYNIRFFKKEYVSWNEMIHSVPLTKGKGLDLPANYDLAIIHHHYKSIEQYIDRMNRYSTKYAKTRHNDGYKFKSADLIKKPMDEFLSRYFFGKGYKDGIHGLALASLQAFFELTIYLKVWQLENFKKKKLNVSKIVEKMKESESDLRYWQNDTLFNEYGGLKNRIKRKLRV